MRQKKTQKPQTKRSAIKPIGVSLLIGVLSSLACMAIAACLLWKLGTLQQGVLSGFTMGIGVLCAGISGFLVGKLSRCKGLLQGSLVGVLLWICYVLSALCFTAVAWESPSIWIRGLAMLCAGGIGGFLSVNQRVKTR